MSGARILVCPLDWGLGHAARCVPVIHALREAGAVPVIAADNGPLELLQKEFPHTEYIRFTGVPVTYPTRGSMVWSMLRQSPKLLAGIRREHRFVEDAVKNRSIQGIISDNRFGAFSQQVPSAYITHQIHIQTGNRLTDALARRQHARYMKRFAQVWIPDVSGENNLSGKLSHGGILPAHAKYIGPLSRFTRAFSAEKKYDAGLILSGPEPQRTLLENQFLQQIGAFPGKQFVLVRGKNESLQMHCPNLTVLPLAHHTDIQMIYAQTAHIVCRSGYSSIMEMALTGRPAWLVPTTGQTEQEYLAKYLDGKYGFRYLHNERFLLKDVLEENGVPAEPFPYASEKSLKKVVGTFLAAVR